MRKKRNKASNPNAARAKPMPGAIHLTVRQSNLLLNYMSLHTRFAERFTHTMRAGDADQLAQLLQRIGIRVKPFIRRLP